MHADRLPHSQRSPNLIFWLDRIRGCIETGAMRRDLDPPLTGITVWAQIHGLVGLHVQGRFGGDEEKFRRVFADSIALTIEGLR